MLAQNLNNSPIIQVEAGRACGAIVYWSLHGYTNFGSLMEKISTLGLPVLPVLPSPEVALRRALSHAHQGMPFILRSLKKSGSWAVISEKTTDNDWEGRHLATVQLSDDKTSIEVTAHDHEASSLYTEFGTQRSVLEPLFRQYTNQLDPQDVSGWLIQLANRLKALSLRKIGGIYYLPPSDLPIWRQAVQALRDCGQTGIQDIPALKTEEAIEALLAALRAEAQLSFEQIRKDLQDQQLGPRGLKTRVQKTEEMVAKIQSYEDLLDRSLLDLTNTANALQADVSRAILLAEAKREEGGS